MGMEKLFLIFRLVFSPQPLNPVVLQMTLVAPISMPTRQACLSPTRPLPLITIQVTKSTKGEQQCKTKQNKNSGFVPLCMIYAQIAKDIENMNVKILPESLTGMLLSQG